MQLSRPLEIKVSPFYRLAACTFVAKHSLVIPFEVFEAREGTHMSFRYLVSMERHVGHTTTDGANESCIATNVPYQVSLSLGPWSFLLTSNLVVSRCPQERD